MGENYKFDTLENATFFTYRPRESILDKGDIFLFFRFYITRKIPSFLYTVYIQMMLDFFLTWMNLNPKKSVDLKNQQNTSLPVKTTPPKFFTTEDNTQ